jgi:hypothetical protein
MRAPLTALLAGLLLVPVGSLAFSAETDALAPPAQKAAEPATTPALDKLGKRASTAHKTVDIFKGKSWYVAPPKAKPVAPPPPPPPPPPTAPPLPYAFMGSYLGKDGRIVIYLTRGDQVFSVSPGDVLEGTYRGGGITSGQLVLIYLPLNIQQTISIGEAS